MRRNTDLSLRGVPEQEFYLQEQSLPVAGASSLHIDSTDSSRMKKQLSLIKAMAQLSSSGVTVYDLHKKVHVYTSRNFYQLFGYGISENQTEVENEVFDKRIHPEDLKALAKNGYTAMKYLMSLPPEQRMFYKMVNEYRILSKDEVYIQVMEQHQVLEQDAQGNIWLSLGVIDISPNQHASEGVKFQIHNFRTGEFINPVDPNEPETTPLTVREREILKMISDGKLSKEISWLLSISVHTVNTHRQRILEKLAVNNSIEAIYSARRQGLIG